MRAENITGPVAHHGEGPVWSPTWGGLRFVDMMAGDLLTLGTDASVTRRHVGDYATMVRPRSRGGYVVGLERGLALVDDEDPASPVRPFPELWSDPTIRLNDGSATPDGAFYAGSMPFDDRAGAGALFRIEPDGAARLVLSGVTCSNGLGFSPDGTLAYYVDTLTCRVDVFDYDAGAAEPLANRRALVEIPREDGLPDGLTVDAEGGVWVALWGGNAVRRYAPDGSLSEVVELPASHVTACTFGGADLDELFITTSRLMIGEPFEPETDAGSVFRVTPGVKGLPVLPFAG
jgi:sugar lactone lactonase YvrE